MRVQVANKNKSGIIVSCSFCDETGEAAGWAAASRNGERRENEDTGYTGGWLGDAIWERDQAAAERG